jgi:hypothetical protein
VISDADSGKWKLERRAPGADRASALTDTQADAMDRAREIPVSQAGRELVMHRPNEQIRDKDKSRRHTTLLHPRG